MSDPEELSAKPDMTLGFLAKQDLYQLSVSDLEERIAAMKSEVARCEAAINSRGGALSDAEKLFKK